MKVIFLDIDGVLTTPLEYAKTTGTEGVSCSHCPFNEMAVKHLNRILDETNAEIVLSSSWRHCFNKIQMNKIMRGQGVNKDIFDFTPSKNDFNNFTQNRVNEISQWLSEHEEIKNWCVIDDSKLKLNKNFVNTKEFIGLIENDMKEVIKILNKRH